jgi:hypothetical protein
LYIGNLIGTNNPNNMATYLTKKHSALTKKIPIPLVPGCNYIVYGEVFITFPYIQSTFPNTTGNKINI